MNWRRIAAYGAVLLATQFAVGFLEGAFAPTRLSIVLVSCIVSFVLCGSIFAHLSARQSYRPFAHAWAALALQVAAASLLWLALTAWLSPTPLASVALEWLVLILALLVGTAVGSSLRRSAGQPADA